MTILQPDTLTGHTLNYIKRYDTIIDAVELIDEQENTKVIATTFSEVEAEYYRSMSFDIDTVLIAYRFYMFHILDATGKILYSDKVFCTDQPIDTFSVNEGTYETAPGTNNEYIIYEQ